MQRFLNPYDEVWDGKDADHTPESNDIPWARQPERKITIEDVKYVLSSHYQGTPFDPYGHLGDEHTRHMYRTIGINRQSQLSVMQIRPYRPQSNRAIQWIAYGSNPFNTLVPFFPNVDTTPKYFEDTTTRVTSENFYWENRIIAALCDAAFSDTANAVERYQEKTGGMAHRLIAATDEQVSRLGGENEAKAKQLEDEFEADNLDGDVEPLEPDQIIEVVRDQEVRDVLAAANQTMADQIKDETDKLLDTVLYITSMKMKNGFNRSDN
jgi:dipeptidase